MEEITLEKIDILRERTGLSYAEAKDALVKCNGNLVDALIFLESTQKSNSKDMLEDMVTTKEELIQWLKDLINKGNVARIKVKKDEKILVDVPVNAGIAAGIVGMVFTPLLGIGIFTAVAAKLTIEITKEDGSVQVVNTVIQNAVNEAKNKVNEFTNDVKDKFNEKKEDINTSDSKVYQYTVKFDEDEKDCNCSMNHEETQNNNENNHECDRNPEESNEEISNQTHNENK